MWVGDTVMCDESLASRYSWFFILVLNPVWQVDLRFRMFQANFPKLPLTCWQHLCNVTQIPLQRSSVYLRTSEDHVLTEV